MLALCSDEGGGFVGMRYSQDDDQTLSELDFGANYWTSPQGRIIRRKLGSDGGRRPPRSFQPPDDSWAWNFGERVHCLWEFQ